MIKHLMKEYALSEKGAKDFVKATIWCYIYNITLMLPVVVIMVALMFVFSQFDLGIQVTAGALKYTLLALLALAVLFVIYYFHYAALYIAVYSESANRRIALAEVLRKLPLAFFSKKDLSDLTSTMITDAALLDQMFSHYIPELYASVLSVITFGIFMFICDWRMALAVLWVVPVAILMTYGAKKLMKNGSKKNLEDKRAVTEAISEGIDTVREIKSCNMEKEYLASLDSIQKREEKSSCRSELTTGSLVSTSQALLKVGIATTIFTGAALTISGSLSFLYYVGFLFAASKLYDPIAVILQNIAAVFASKVRIERMKGILEAKPQTGATEYTTDGYDIDFDNVSFAYNEEEGILKNVSFVAKQGEVTALVGPSGGGKTTATRLAARFWDVDNGKITLGGTDVKTVEPEALLTNYSIVFQDVVLFKDTIMENIRLGKKGASDEEVLRAAKAACCDEFALNLPDGYNTLIGENGCTLSGGERQRISIARALLKDAPVILLDEATASLDVENENSIQSALSKLIKGKTILIIAHRMRTVENADHIVVLENGTISEQGKPEELLKKGGTFAKMVALQKESSAWKL